MALNARERAIICGSQRARSERANNLGERAITKGEFRAPPVLNAFKFTRAFKNGHKPRVRVLATDLRAIPLDRTNWLWHNAQTSQTKHTQPITRSHGLPDVLWITRVGLDLAEWHHFVPDTSITGTAVTGGRGESTNMTCIWYLRAISTDFRSAKHCVATRVHEDDAAPCWVRGGQARDISQKTS